MNGAEFWAYYYKDFFKDRPYLDGIQFDVSSFVAGNASKANKVDINNDGKADFGIVDGVNVAGLGIQLALKKMREYIGNNKILVYDYENPQQARSTKYIDGASFEAALIENHVVGREFAYMEGINEMITESPLRYSYIQQVPNGDGTIDALIGRMGIASACMLEVPYVNQYSRTFGEVYWRDEYFGGEDINKQGWLGEPIGPIIRTTHFNTASNLLKNANWSLQKDAGYNAAYTKANGEHNINVVQTAGNVSGVRLASNFAVSNVVAGKTYTLIFEARGDDDFVFYNHTFENVPRYLELINSGARGNTVNGLSSIGENVTDHWRRYEISFIASGSGSTSKFLSFGVGEMYGITQLRNIQLYRGSSHVLMRQFENGIALLNANETENTFELPEYYRRIDGKYTADVNDGSYVGNSVTVRAWDGLLLVRTDAHPLKTKGSDLAPSIHVFPNPAQSILHIFIAENVIIQNLSLYSIQGQLLQTHNTKNSTNSIDISDLEDGIYVLRLQTHHKKYNVKFTKN